MQKLGENANLEVIYCNGEKFVVVCCDECIVHVELAIKMLSEQGGKEH